ncbi:Os10g0347400 [Oryza sativa Japonica Group]|uniref:Os10g0347400 protein n=1 Tax=Oryza sativa subsp. japonica TaxID=39947 RepID=A0A0P0XT40_ORYSJ|nr:Os10g0347400 [Oryza sativa Japonica Group]
MGPTWAPHVRMPRQQASLSLPLSFLLLLYLSIFSLYSGQAGFIGGGNVVGAALHDCDRCSDAAPAPGTTSGRDERRRARLRVLKNGRDFTSVAPAAGPMAGGEVLGERQVMRSRASASAGPNDLAITGSAMRPKGWRGVERQQEWWAAVIKYK